MRARAVTAIATTQTAYTLLIAALAVYCVVLARATAGNPHASGGLIVGAICLGVLTVLYALGAVGLWRVRRWGWILSLGVNALIPSLVLWETFVEHERDPDNWVAIAIFGLPILLLLLPAVRRPFWPRPQVAVGPLTTNSY